VSILGLLSFVLSVWPRELIKHPHNIPCTSVTLTLIKQPTVCVIIVCIRFEIAFVSGIVELMETVTSHINRLKIGITELFYFAVLIAPAMHVV
jgi:hypothetical protein